MSCGWRNKAAPHKTKGTRHRPVAKSACLLAVILCAGLGAIETPQSVKASGAGDSFYFHGAGNSSPLAPESLAVCYGCLAGFRGDRWSFGDVALVVTLSGALVNGYVTFSVLAKVSSSLAIQFQQSCSGALG